MKLDTTPQDVAVAGNFETTAFGMEASAHAFDIIADKIYTHKERAVIREICCNAHDSHVEAGNPEPFDVHLPTQLEPYFSVRDYGIGLSDKDVRFVFCNTFRSTKRDSNEQIGCLGLGSKSPFSLTDSFTVISWYNGLCRTYSCYRDEQRIPVVALLTEVASDEPNGLKISFTIEDKSYEFQQEAVNVFRYWDYTPNLNNKEVVKQVQELRDCYKFTGEDFGLSSGYGSMKAIMGNVSYSIPDEIEELGVNGYLKFELGEISFDAGRESLSLDDKTKQVIKDKFKSVKDKIGDEAAKQIESLPTDWERAKLCHELSKGSLGRIMKLDLTQYELPKTSEEMTFFVKSWRTIDKGETTKIPLGDQILYYEFKPRFQSRIRSYLKGFNDNKTIVLMTSEQVVETGIDPTIIKDLDTLPKIHRSTGGVGCTVKTFTLDKSVDRYSWQAKDSWVQNELDVDGEEMVYIEINRFEPVEKQGFNFTNLQIKKLIARLEKAGVSVPEIHGLKSVYTKTKAFEKGNWTHLGEYMRREVEKIAPKSYPEADENDVQLMTDINRCVEGVPELDAWNEIIKNQPEENILSLCKTIPNLEIAKDTALQGHFDGFMEEYPMLKLLNRWDINHRNAETISSYLGGRAKDENNE